MISFLSRLFIKNRDDKRDPTVRKSYGMLCGICGIALNVILFGLKFFAGSLCGSIAITADAFNNLSDAGSSVITLIGFKLAGAAPDPEHPFGHGRLEYISGFIVSLLIILMGYELGRSSIEKIISPEAVDTSLVAVVILIISILVKFYMHLYNKKLGKELNSTAMQATATDSISDCAATGVVLIATLFMRLTSINIDGWCGVAVAAFILYAGFNAAKETMAPLLGQPPDPEFVKGIEETVMAHPEVTGIHDLIVHDYGPGRLMISLHAEVPGDGDINVLHDAIDCAESELCKKYGCQAVIHLDPLCYDDERTAHLFSEIKAAAQSLDDRLTVHDFRMVSGPTHTNLIFDVVVPIGFTMTNDDVRNKISGIITAFHPECFCVINIDKSYI